VKSCEEFLEKWVHGSSLSEMNAHMERLEKLIEAKGLCAKLTCIAISIICEELVTRSMVKYVVDRLCEIYNKEECRDAAKCVRMGLKALEEIGLVVKTGKGAYRYCLYEPASAMLMRIAEPIIRRQSKNFAEYAIMHLFTHGYILIELMKRIAEQSGNEEIKKLVEKIDRNYEQRLKKIK